MALTIDKEPASPLLTKNEIAYKVTTSDAAVEKIVAHLVIETAPYSGVWELLKKVEQSPNPDDGYSCWFFFHDVLDREMEYSDPPSATATVDTDMCRRIRVEFYEYKSTDLVLHAELYSETHQIIEVTDFATSTDYLILIDYSESNMTEALRVRIGNGINTTPDPDTLASPLTISTAWQLASDTGYQLERTSNPGLNAGYDDVVVPAKTSVKIYQWNKPTTTLSEIRYAIKGGINPTFFAEMTKDPDYWVDENLDNVVDSSGNLINT